MGPPAQMIPQRNNLTRMPYGPQTGAYGTMPMGNMYSQPLLSQPPPPNGGDTTPTRSRPVPQQQQYPILQQEQQRQMAQTTTQFIQQQQTNVFQRSGLPMQMGYPMPSNNFMQQQQAYQQQQLRNNPVIIFCFIKNEFKFKVLN